MSANNYQGSITAIIGPMCGGKTTRLITEKRKNEIAGRKVLLIKHPSDERYSTNEDVTTHDRATEKGYKARDPNFLMDCGLPMQELIKFDVVCVDEGQFYQDVDIFCETLANLGIKVYVSALLGTYKREPFLNIARLLALSENIIHTKAVDRNTGEDASFTLKRTVKGDSPVIEVGGLDLYEAVGRRTYFQNLSS